MFLRDLGIGSIIFRLDELDVSPQVVRALEHANPGDGSPTNRPRAFYRALQAAGITTRAGGRKLDIIHRLGCGVRACGSRGNLLPYAAFWVHPRNRDPSIPTTNCGRLGVAYDPNCRSEASKH
jgi:hypothetical protein